MGVYVSDENGKLKKYGGRQAYPDGVSVDINNINNKLTKTEQVDVVYDMYDNDKDWGYSGGLQSGTKITGKNFSQYKFLRVYCTRFRIGFVGYIDFKQVLPTSAYVYSGTAVIGVVDGTTPYWTLGQFSVDSSKTTFNVDGFWQNGAVKNESGYIVTRIEGVY